jgi:hypothetical protein
MQFAIEFPNPTGETTLFHFGRKSPHLLGRQARAMRFGQNLGAPGVWEIKRPHLLCTFNVHYHDILMNRDYLYLSD